MRASNMDVPAIGGVMMFRRSIFGMFVFIHVLFITACGGGGSSTSTEISLSPPITINIAVSPRNITLGSSAQLSWSSSNASSCTASGNWSGDQPTTSTNPPTVVTPSAIGTYTYTLTCSGTGGTQQASAQLRVVTAAGLTTQISAAAATANNPDPASSCGYISQSTSPNTSNNGFYWEIGDENGVISDGYGNSAAGSVQPAGSATQYTRSTLLMIASATKWLYGSYVAEIQATQSNGSYSIPGAYLPYLNFTSGYDNMSDSCPISQTPTIADCLAASNGKLINPLPNGTLSSNDIGHFYYNSGHLEVLEGELLGGGTHSANDLANEILYAFSLRGITMNLDFVAPIAAGGGFTNAGNYAEFLKGLIRSNNPLIMGSLLRPTVSNPYAVCTNPLDPACGTARYSPLPNISWHYSIAHWIEDDINGDGSYSSPGKFGFYPWVDASKSYYGMVVRYDSNSTLVAADAPYYHSVLCGQAIRKAFFTGVQQP